MSIKSTTAFILLCFTSYLGSAQLPDCTLGLGSAELGTISAIFQLSEEQQIMVKELQGKLQLATKNQEDQVQRLFEDHPQSSEAELLVLAKKYRDIQQKIVDLSAESDIELLKTFNGKQYQRYMDLCEEAFRDPIKIVPKVYNDSIPPR